MTIRDLTSALAAAAERMDLIFFDACYMQSIEVSYELRNSGAKYIVGSQAPSSPVMPFDKIFAELASNPDQTLLDFAKNINDRYAEKYQAGDYFTQSTVELAKIAAVVDAHTAFVQAIVSKAGLAAQQTQAARVSARIADAVVYNRSGGAAAGYTGLGIYVPEPLTALEDEELGLTYMQSSAGEYVSMYVVGQPAGGAAGVMGTPALVKAGDRTYPGQRGGDDSGITVDSVTDSFWAANEVILSDTRWSTRIGEFRVSPLLDEDWYAVPVNAGGWFPPRFRAVRVVRGQSSGLARKFQANEGPMIERTTFRGNRRRATGNQCRFLARGERDALQPEHLISRADGPRVQDLVAGRQRCFTDECGMIRGRRGVAWRRPGKLGRALAGGRVVEDSGLEHSIYGKPPG